MWLLLCLMLAMQSHNRLTHSVHNDVEVGERLLPQSKTMILSINYLSLVHMIHYCVSQIEVNSTGLKFMSYHRLAGLLAVNP